MTAVKGTIEFNIETASLFINGHIRKTLIVRNEMTDPIQFKGDIVFILPKVLSWLTVPSKISCPLPIIKLITAVSMSLRVEWSREWLFLPLD